MVVVVDENDENDDELIEIEIANDVACDDDDDDDDWDELEEEEEEDGVER